MIPVRRLNGTEVVINADLIETVEATPDTVITLVDGKKYLVADPVSEIVERVRRWRAGVLAAADHAGAAHVPAVALHVVPDPSEEG